MRRTPEPDEGDAIKAAADRALRAALGLDGDGDAGAGEVVAAEDDDDDACDEVETCRNDVSEFRRCSRSDSDAGEVELSAAAALANDSGDNDGGGGVEEAETDTDRSGCADGTKSPRAG